MHSPKVLRVLPLTREGGGVVQPDGWRPQREMRACGTCPGGWPALRGARSTTVRQRDTWNVVELGPAPG